MRNSVKPSNSLTTSGAESTVAGIRIFLTQPMKRCQLSLPYWSKIKRWRQLVETFVVSILPPLSLSFVCQLTCLQTQYQQRVEFSVSVFPFFIIIYLFIFTFLIQIYKVERNCLTVTVDAFYPSNLCRSYFSLSFIFNTSLHFALFSFFAQLSLSLSMLPAHRCSVTLPLVDLLIFFFSD